MNIQEGIIKADLKKMITKISGAIGYKHDPKMRQELLAAFEEDIINIMNKHGYVAEGEDSEFFKGGVANGMSAEDLADHHDISIEAIEKALAKGQNVELEHTDDASKAYEIAKDHIYEDPKYYDKLERVEEAEDHEVGMAMGQLKAIHKSAGELEEKIGNEEKDLPGWIQSHITSAYEYLKQANDNFHELKESDFYNITPDKLGGMGPITLPGVDTPGSGDVPAGVGSAKDRYEEEEDKRKKKNKKKRILEFSEFVKEQKQQTAFAPEQPKKEMLGEDEYGVGPSNDPDEEMRERAKHINKARNVITLRDF